MNDFNRIKADSDDIRNFQKLFYETSRLADKTLDLLFIVELYSIVESLFLNFSYLLTSETINDFRKGLNEFYNEYVNFRIGSKTDGWDKRAELLNKIKVLYSDLLKELKKE